MDIIEKKSAISEELQQAIRNYKKSPAERKTLKYLQQQSMKLQELWEGFNTTDKLIRNSSIPEDHEYYTSDLFGKIGGIFNATYSKIEEEIVQLKRASNPSTIASTSTTTNQESGASSLPGATLPLKILKGITAVKLLLQQAREDPGSTQSSLMKLNTVENHWQMVRKLHEQLWMTANDDYDLDEFLQQEALINEELGKLSKQCGSTNKNNYSGIHVEAAADRVKLPKIELPSFDGDYTKWRPFKDLFVEMVHRQQLSDCQKLWYLKSSLTGEASRLIQHLSTTSENYSSAWEIVKNRYENNRLIISTILQRLLSQQSVQRDSASSIKLLHDQSQECLLGLQAMGLNIDSWDPFLVHILSQLLDRTTQMLWEQSLTDPRELPSVHDFMKFLEMRFQSLEAVGPSRKMTSQSSNSLMATIETCISCNQAHALFRCPKYKNMKPTQRLQLAQNSKLCINCLKQNHKTKECPSLKNCHRCNKRHHTLLHLDTQYHKEEHTKPPPSTKQQYKSAQSGSTSSSLFATPSHERSSVLLSTAVLMVDDAFGRAILDSGSQVNLITKEFANKLGLEQVNHHLRIQGVGEAHHNACIKMTVILVYKRK